IYLLLDAQDLSAVQEGVLESEIIAVTGPNACFHLFYLIADESDASIAIEVRDETGSVINKWKVADGRNNSWTPFVQDMASLPGHFTIRIIGTPGKQRRSDVAIDDITLFGGKCSREPHGTTSAPSPSSVPTTRTAPTTQPSTKSVPVTSPAEKTAEVSTATSTPRTTTPKVMVNCAPGQFNCRDNENCIPLGLLCDGVKDCPNGIDEKCGVCKKLCTDTWSLCLYHVIVITEPHHYRCDGHPDCSDGADESLCGYCPLYYCRNGGHCNLDSDQKSPSCTCPDGTSGERCQLLASSA
ncbi:unnamed protein product, partial [Ixodes hexagonus]